MRCFIIRKTRVLHCSESEALEDGKVLFFKTVGIDVVRVKDYESVYKIISA